MEKTNIFVIGGPTGCGETTISNAIIAKLPQFARLVAATTRAPRNNEKNGVEYYYFSKEKFKQEIQNGNIPEYTYMENRDTYYGSYKPDLDKKLEEGFKIIANTDVVGAKYFKEAYGAVTIFIKPDSMDNLKKRLLKRQPDISEDELQKRIVNSEDEIKNEEKFYEYIVINEEGKLDEAIEKTAEIIKKYI
jgi:guanylate kinase